MTLALNWKSRSGYVNLGLVFFFIIMARQLGFEFTILPARERSSTVSLPDAAASVPPRFPS